MNPQMRLTLILISMHQQNFIFTFLALLPYRAKLIGDGRPNGPTVRSTDGQTDGRTDAAAHLEMRGRILKTPCFDLMGDFRAIRQSDTPRPFGNDKCA